jgi:hypothetical protein
MSQEEEKREKDRERQERLQVANDKKRAAMEVSPPLPPLLKRTLALLYTLALLSTHAHSLQNKKSSAVCDSGSGFNSSTTTECDWMLSFHRY